jgi:hypothetical protein
VQQERQRFEVKETSKNFRTQYFLTPQKLKAKKLDGA